MMQLLGQCVCVCQLLFFSFLVMEIFALHVKCSNNLKQIMYGLEA